MPGRLIEGSGYRSSCSHGEIKALPQHNPGTGEAPMERKGSRILWTEKEIVWGLQLASLLWRMHSLPCTYWWKLESHRGLCSLPRTVPCQEISSSGYGAVLEQSSEPSLALLGC